MAANCASIYLRTGRHRLEIMCFAPSLEMGEIGGIVP